MRGLSGAAVIGGFAILVESLNFTGFCWEKMTYYNDHDLIDAAVQNDLKFYDPNSGPLTKKYNSLGDFHRINPNCCVLYRWGHGYASDFRIVGLYRVVVDAWFRSQDNGPVPFYQSLTVLNACAEPQWVTGSSQSYARP
jgi:hypothetical protein